MADKEKSIPDHLEAINDVLRRDPAIKSVEGALAALKVPVVKTAAEAIAILKENPNAMVKLQFTGISAEQRQAMHRELEEYFAEHRRSLKKNSHL